MCRLFHAVAILCAIVMVPGCGSSSGAGGAPSATATPGITQGEPTLSASPEVIPTVDLGSLPRGEPPAGLAAISACRSREDMRAVFDQLLDQPDGWKLASFNPGRPPEVMLVFFESQHDGERMIAVSAAKTPFDGGAAQSVVRWTGEGTTDGTLVWSRRMVNVFHNLTWGIDGDELVFQVSASETQEVDEMVVALAQAAREACS